MYSFDQLMSHINQISPDDDQPDLDILKNLPLEIVLIILSKLDNDSLLNCALVSPAAEASPPSMDLPSLSTPADPPTVQRPPSDCQQITPTEAPSSSTTFPFLRTLAKLPPAQASPNGRLANADDLDRKELA
ncbi:hypothetical protein TSAR_000875 [Trichomalopsis sarcophagae]|uniref:F-box domain-containing protein n=1 Tax=Trichomalopsis sarcophagae TaxID=543379 RepID=A0A232EYM4_9HYME|nr:hypothetical protein TSAR_000875 [Trichomalopsis sarcophagae]